MKKLFTFVLPGLVGLAVIFLSLPYISGGVSTFMGKWAYDWGVPAPLLKFILVCIVAIVVVLVMRFLKKLGVLLVVAILILALISPVVFSKIIPNTSDIMNYIHGASSQIEPVIAATKDLFYQSVSYATAVNPIETIENLAKGEETFWYLSEGEVTDTTKLFPGYKVAEKKEVEKFVAYKMVKE